MAQKSFPTSPGQKKKPKPKTKTYVISFLSDWQLSTQSHLLWEVAQTKDRGQTACFKHQERQQMQQLTGKDFRNSSW